MARRQDRKKVINLRKQGKTYSEIRRELNIPKSTLSDWLRNYPLNEEQLALLKKTIKRNKDIAIEHCRLTKQKKREKRLSVFYKKERKKLIPLFRKELYIAGLFLYWGEGNKSLKGSLSLNNTDPKVVQFYLYWLLKVLMIPKEKIKIHLHFYNDMDKEEEMNFWSKKLTIPLKQFNKPYIKKSKRIDIDQKGFGHGTCGVGVNNTRLKEKIMMGIEAIANFYSEKIR